MPLTQTLSMPLFLFPSVPAERPSGQCLILSREEFQRIKESSRVLTKEEREAKVAALKAEKDTITVGASFCFLCASWFLGRVQGVV